MQAGETPAQPEAVQWTGIRIHKYVDTEPPGLVVHITGQPDADQSGPAEPPPG